MQYRAMVDGAAFANTLGDYSGALVYSSQAGQIVSSSFETANQKSSTFYQFWDPANNHLIAYVSLHSSLMSGT